jgi:tetrapyrrole methylase family protein/MazG family protein
MSAPYAELPALIARLRAPDGCPWDREQTHRSLRPYLLEEAYETLDAIDDEDPRRLSDELGDLLLQVLLHAQIASEAGSFDIDAVSRRLAEKLIRRHPHVFGDEAYAGADHVTRWEQLKRAESAEPKSVIAGVPASLPALFMTDRLLERAERVKVRPPLEENADGIGERLFALAADARKKGLDPEQELRAVNRRFAERFERFEALAKLNGRELETLTPHEVEDLWRQAG